MSIFKKAAKVVKRGAKRGVRLGAKVAKKTPPYGVGRVAGSLVRGKTPRTSDMLTAVGMPPMKKGSDARKFKKMLPQRAKMMPVERKRLRQRTAIGTAWSMPPKVAASSTSRPPTPRRKPSARAQSRAEALGRNLGRRA